VRGGIAVAEALSEPEMLKSVLTIAEAGATVTRSPGFTFAASAAGMAVNALHTAAGEAGLTEGDGLQARLKAGADLLLTLSEPDTMASVHRLTTQAIALEPLLGRLATLLENFDPDSFAAIAETASKPEVNQARRDLMELAPVLRRPLSILPNQPHTLEMLDHINVAFNDASINAQQVGAFGVLTALRDPDVQRSVGVALAVARELGRSFSKLQLTTTAEAK